MKPLIYSQHALRRMFERGLHEEDVAAVVNAGEVIEAYPDDAPAPSTLVLGYIRGGIPVHTVVADAPEARIVVTVYIPDAARWEPGFRRRRRR